MTFGINLLVVRQLLQSQLSTELEMRPCRRHASRYSTNLAQQTILGIQQHTHWSYEPKI